MNKTDKKIVEYLERARKITKLTVVTNLEIIEIAKMIQKEEHDRNTTE